METILKIAGIGIISSVLAALIKKNNSELSLLLSIAVCLIILFTVLTVLEPIKEFIEQLRDISGLSPAVLAPLLKAVGIGIVTKIASSICADAKEGAVSSFIEMAGAVLAIYVSLPLMSSVLELLSSML